MPRRRDGFHAGSLGVAWAARARGRAARRRRSCAARARARCSRVARLPLDRPDAPRRRARAPPGAIRRRCWRSPTRSSGRARRRAVASGGGELIGRRATVTRHGWSWREHPAGATAHPVRRWRTARRGIGWALLELFAATGDARFARRGQRRVRLRAVVAGRGVGHVAGPPDRRSRRGAVAASRRRRSARGATARPASRSAGCARSTCWATASLPGRRHRARDDPPSSSPTPAVRARRSVALPRAAGCGRRAADRGRRARRRRRRGAGAELGRAALERYGAAATGRAARRRHDARRCSAGSAASAGGSCGSTTRRSRRRSRCHARVDSVTPVTERRFDDRSAPARRGG